MKKIKYSFVLILTLLVLIYSCDDPNFGIPNPFEGTDYEVLATENEEDITKFLSTHYYNEVLDSIKPIENGETSLLNSDNLKIQQVNETIDNIDITFNLYTYVIEEGDGNVEHNEINGGKPTNIDSLLVNYSGRVLIPEGTVVIDGVETVVGNSLTTGNFDSGLTTWISSGILGWSYGFTNFKPGNIIINQGEKINFNGTGKGFIFIPSGLGYPSNLFDPRINRATDFPYDQVLVFKVELLDFVPDTDHDNDGVPSILESPDCDKNPRNDSNDKFFPGLADYLNPNITKSFDCNR